MTLLKSRLAIDDFMLEMLRVPPAQLQLHHLQDWVAHLDLDEDLFRQHLEFCDQGYRRKLVCRTSRFDMLILCWKPGQASSIHDHANSLNVTRVYQGVLTARVFAPVSADISADIAAAHAARCCNQPALQLQTETELSQNGLAAVERYQIHQLANTSTENLVTLHVYARPLQNLQVYCPHSGRSEAVPVQYESV
jgi:predicted metal-dependent enzyme (double-stranded beta helix superfamily)